MKIDTTVPLPRTVRTLPAAEVKPPPSRDTLLPGAKDDLVRQAEQQLKGLGYEVGKVDGVMDEKLADAIVAFKRAHPELANVGRYLGGGARTAIASAAGVTAKVTQLPGAEAPRSLVLSEISDQAWAALYPKLAADLKSGNLPRGSQISIGTYGIDPAMAADIDRLRALGAKVKFTPAFSLVQKHPEGMPWSSRRPGVGGDPAFAGQVPPYREMKTDAERYAWGREIGRRFRDSIEAAKAKGVNVDGWMLDEVWPSANKADIGQGIRELMRGVMDGISKGRDGEVMKGLVFVANLPGLVKAEQTPELKKFWQSLNAASSQVVQEEYPVFARGREGARAAAANANAADAKLKALGPAAAAIARKIVSGMSPGYNAGATHGTFKPDGAGGYESLRLTAAEVAAWRKTYMDARETAGVVGFGEYGLLKNNAEKKVIDPLVNQLAEEILRVV